jgi:hypothetical protein
MVGFFCKMYLFACFSWVTLEFSVETVQHWALPPRGQLEFEERFTASLWDLEAEADPVERELPPLPFMSPQAVHRVHMVHEEGASLWKIITMAFCVL